MFMQGHVTDTAQAKALYDAYGIPYRVMKRSGEIRARMSRNSYDFSKDVQKILIRAGADWILDHMDICEDSHGDYIFIASPDNGYIGPELKEQIEKCGYEISETEFRPYDHLKAIVVTKISR